MDLNCDMGESFGRYTLGMDPEVIASITSANIACGFHASDPLVMDRTLELAKKHGVGVGAHPGYLDLRGFGRRDMACSFEEIRTDVTYQVGALAGLALARGLKLQHIKPHGALYNTAARDEAVARAVCAGVLPWQDQVLLVAMAGPGGEVIRQVAAETGLRVAAEAFADRAYTPEGRLVPRNQEGAVINDAQAVAARCLRMATEGVVEAIDGSLVPLRPDTICVHGDTPSAVELVKSVRAALTQAGVELAPMGKAL